MKRSLVRFIAKYVKFLKNLVIVLSVWAIKEAVTRLTFSCPCFNSNRPSDWWTSKEARQLYGSLFIVTPMIVFWFIGIFLQETTWRCLTGWRVQEKFVYPGRSCLCFFSTLGSTSLAPMTWIFLLFLDGSYLECIESTTPAGCNPVDPSESTKIVVISQVTACVIAIGCFILYLTVKLLEACCGSMTYYQLRHAQYIQKLEEETFYEASEEYHRSEMKKKWKNLFTAGSASDWDQVSELPPNDPIYRKRHTHYTPFQNWNGVVAPSSKNREPDSSESNMVTIVVHSDANSKVDINRDHYNNHIWSTNNTFPRGRNLPIPAPVLPPMTYSSLDATNTAHPNGHTIYSSLAGSRDLDKCSPGYGDDSFPPPMVQTSTPKVKKKKSGKKKNKIQDTEEE